MLSADYNIEQKSLQEAVPEKGDSLEKLKTKAIAARSTIIGVVFLPL